MSDSEKATKVEVKAKPAVKPESKEDQPKEKITLADMNKAARKIQENIAKTAATE